MGCRFVWDCIVMLDVLYVLFFFFGKILLEVKGCLFCCDCCWDWGNGLGVEILIMVWLLIFGKVELDFFGLLLMLVKFWCFNKCNVMFILGKVD